MKHYKFAASFYLAMVAMIMVTGSAFADQRYEKYPDGVKIRDVEKTVINQVPYNVEVCREVQTYGNGPAVDSTGDMIIGGIIGGLVGNQIGKGSGNKVATGVGAVTGAIIANNKAQKNNRVVTGTSTQCSVETRYKEQTVTVYSHSVATFWHEGRKYSVEFIK